MEKTLNLAHPHLPEIRMRMCQFRNGAAAVVCVSMLQACSGSDGPTTPQQKPVATVSVALAKSLVFVGGTTQATATVHDADGATLSNRTITWSSSANSVATVTSSGIVTAVAAGTANITATSEGKSGFAPLTVNVDPATTAQVRIQGLKQNGVAVDLAKVVGTVNLEVEETVPSGFTGTITITADTVVLSRTTYPSAFLGGSADAASASAINSAGGATMLRSVEMQTATPIITVTDDQLQAVPQYRNVAHLLSVTMTGTVGATPVNQVAQQSFTTANISSGVYVAGRFENPRTLVLVDGRRFNTGSSFKASYAAVDFNAVPAAEVDRIEVITGDKSSVYGSDAIGSVVNIITKKREFTTSEFGCESGQLGTIFQVSGITRGNTTVNPRTQPFVFNGYTSDADRDGQPDVAAAPAGITLPGSATGQIVISDWGSQLPAGWFNLANPLFCDNRGPQINDGAFDFLGRSLSLFLPFVTPAGDLPPTSNMLEPEFNLQQFLDATKVNDRGVGMRTTNPFEYYVGTGTTAVTVTTPSNKWQLGQSLTPSIGYNYRAALKTFDRFDNESSRLLSTTLSNPYGVNGTATSAGQVASIRVANGAGTITNSGVKDRSWSANSSANLQYGFDIAGGVLGATDNPISAVIRRNGTCFYNCDPVFLPTTRTGNTARINLNTIKTQVGGDPQGVWDLTFTGYSATGRAFSPTMNRIRIDHDWTPPSLPVASTGNPFTGPFLAGQVIPFAFSGTDNTAITQGGVQLRFEGFPHPGFERGYVEVPWYTTMWMSPYTTPLANRSLSFSTAIPTRFALAAPGTGLVSAPYYNVTGVSYFDYDGVDQRSPLLDFGLNPAWLPSFTPFNNLRVNITNDAPTVCLRRAESSTACAANIPTTATITGTATYPTADDPGITEMHVYAITPLKQVVRICRTINVMSLLPIGSDTRKTFQCLADMDDYKGPVGQLTIFAWFVSTVRWIVAKTQFLDIFGFFGAL